MDQLDSDSAYFERRTSEEQAAAERARDPRTRQIHIDLAERYSDAARAGRVGPTGDEPEEAWDPKPRLASEFRILT